MNSELLQIVEICLAIIIALATIWIGFSANKISKRQIELDMARQKLVWCRSCLKVMSKIVSLGQHTNSEITEAEFKLLRRELRAEIIALKNEGELFIVSKPSDITK